MISSQAREGATLLQRGLLKEATRAFAQGVEANPKDESSLLGLGRTLLAQGQTRRALKVLQRLLAVHPNHPEAVSHLARYRALRGDPKALEALRVLSAHPDAKFPEHYNLGLVQLRRREFAEAEAAFNRALDLSPDNPQVLTYLGSLAHRKGELKDALSYLRIATENSRKESYPLLLLARVFVGLGNIPAAISALEDGLRRNPAAMELGTDLIQLQLVAGKPQAAIQLAEDLRKRKPDAAHPAYLHGLALLTVGKAEEARAALEQALAKGPRSWEVRVALARVERLAKNAARADALLEEAVALAPSQIGPATDLALSHLQAGKPEQAQAVLAKALAAHPEDAGLNLNMAIALRRTSPDAALHHAGVALASAKPALREQAERLIAELKSAPRA